jgi:hypothetical protein
MRAVKALQRLQPGGACQSARCRRSSAEPWSDAGWCDARVHARTIRVWQGSTGFGSLASSSHAAVASFPRLKEMRCVHNEHSRRLHLRGFPGSVLPRGFCSPCLDGGGSRCERRRKRVREALAIGRAQPVRLLRTRCGSAPEACELAGLGCGGGWARSGAEPDAAQLCRSARAGAALARRARRVRG